MLTDLIRLLLFPALMAFAASSDLLTMTISNRISLALAGGFLLLALITGMSLAAVGLHLAAADPAAGKAAECDRQHHRGGGEMQADRGQTHAGDQGEQQESAGQRQRDTVGNG